MVAIWSSLSDMSFWNFWMPTVLSRCQGGMLRVATRCLMAFAQGRVSSYVTRDMGAIDAFAMAVLAFLLEDRRDILGEGYGFGCGLGGKRHACKGQKKSQRRSSSILSKIIVPSPLRSSPVAR